jgi:Ran GTPase-activating protein (RanGAP) involved in mRNA processing and transport
LLTENDKKFISREEIKEGKSLLPEEINRYFENRSYLNLLLKNVHFPNGNIMLSGRIGKIESSSSIKVMAFWINGYEFKVFLNQIVSFKAEGVKDYLCFPMIIDFLSYADISSSYVKEIPVVTLMSKGEKIVVNQERLKKEIPYFEAMFRGQTKESTLREVDLSQSLSFSQLNLIFKYLDGEIQFNESNIIDLFIISDFLCMEDLFLKIKEYLIKTLTLEDIEEKKVNIDYEPLKDFLGNISEEIIQFYQNQPIDFFKKKQYLLTTRNPLNKLKDLTIDVIKWIALKEEGINFYLESEEIIDVLRLFKILGIHLLNILNINDQTLIILSETLKRISHIELLNISWGIEHKEKNGLTDSGAFYLSEILKTLPSLKGLKISSHKMSDKGIRLIVDALKDNTSLEKLDLSHNNLSTETFEYILENLLKNKNLKCLKLNSTGLGEGLNSEGKYIKLLSENSSLEELHLVKNNINDSGAKGFAEIIKNNTSLKVIDMWGNNISSAGLKILEESLKENISLFQVKINNINGNKYLSTVLRDTLS